jgi:hypothetical protein
MRNSGALLAAVLFTALTTAGASDPSPYVGFEAREIKALSEDQVAGYLEGRGMGFALTAELNRFPGPKHVIELADALELEESQLTAVQRSFDRMHLEAVRLGQELVTRERELDLLFAEGRVDETGLEQIVAEIGRVTGQLRFVHLRAHLEMREVLSVEQIDAYAALRGYASSTHAPEGGECPHGRQ